MREIVEKLAVLYDTIEKARKILRFSNIPIISIPFHPAADTNWLNIYDEISLKPLMLIRLYQEVKRDCSEEDKIFFQSLIDQIKAQQPINPFPVLPDGKIDPNIFNKHFIYSNLPFLNRQNVKNRLKLMLNEPKKPNSPKVLLIEGQPFSGLTHSQLYIADIITSSEKYALAQILHSDNEKESEFISGAQIANIISSQLEINYKVEEDDKISLSKYTTFFTKLKELSKKGDANGKIPVICLDGMYRITNPDLNRFIIALLHEAITHKNFYVILTLTENNLMKREWPVRLKYLPSVKIHSFEEKHLRAFVESSYSKYDDKVDFGFTIQDLCDTWMNKNSAHFDFTGQKLNVSEIGAFCTTWYTKFSEKLDSKLNET